MKIQEHVLQTHIFRYLRYKKIFCFAIPNGQKRNPKIGRSLKEEGVQPGVSDLIILLPNSKTIFAEIKAGKNKQTESQLAFEQVVKSMGFEYVVWRDLEDAIQWSNKIN